MSSPTIKRGVVGVLYQSDRFLVIKRSRHVRSPGAFCFPGGTIEPGESEELAVVRELREELSLHIKPVRRLLATETPWRVALAWWLICADDLDCMAANPSEVESVHWLTATELRLLAGLLPTNRAFLDAWERGDFSLEHSGPNGLAGD